MYYSSPVFPQPTRHLEFTIPACIMPANAEILIPCPDPARKRVLWAPEPSQMQWEIWLWKAEQLPRRGRGRGSSG